MEFQAWPKISRLNSPYVITEKIDGTNACVVVEPTAGFRTQEALESAQNTSKVVELGCDLYLVAAQSRTRIITPDNDNYGFGRWVWDNAESLAAAFGPGYHFGEWYGSGIQRRYGLDCKYFALFNTGRWEGFNNGGPLYDIGVRHVPILSEGEHFSFDILNTAVDKLQSDGSRVNSEFKNPEGVVVHFKHNRVNFKYILDK